MFEQWEHMCYIEFSSGTIQQNQNIKELIENAECNKYFSTCSKLF